MQSHLQVVEGDDFLGDDPMVSQLKDFSTADALGEEYGRIPVTKTPSVAKHPSFTNDTTVASHLSIANTKLASAHKSIAGQDTSVANDILAAALKRVASNKMRKNAAQRKKAKLWKASHDQPKAGGINKNPFTYRGIDKLYSLLERKMVVHA